jgi:hypothetical protein
MMFIFSPVPMYDHFVPFGYYRVYKSDEIKFSHGVVWDGVVTVMAVQDSVVEESGFSEEWGGYALLKHADDLYSFYAHGAEAPKFKAGDRVGAAEYVFESSDNGNTDRPKFYFELRKERDGGQLDPGAYIFPGGVAPGVLPPPQAKLDVNGVMDKETWKALQLALKCNLTFSYLGIIDGIPGPMTWQSLKESLTLLVDETGIGTEEEETIKGLQRRLAAMGEYDGFETGELDLETVSALQRTLNLGTFK